MKNYILQITIIIFTALFMSCGGTIETNYKNNKQIETRTAIEVSEDDGVPIIGGESFEVKEYTEYLIFEYSKNLIKLKYSDDFHNINKVGIVDQRISRIPNSTKFVKIYFIDRGKEMTSKIFEIFKTIKDATNTSNINKGNKKIEEVTLSWNDSNISNEEIVNINNQGTVSYYISYEKLEIASELPSDTHNYTDEIKITSTNDIINDLVPNTYYNLRIRAKNTQKNYSDYYSIHSKIGKQNEVNFEIKNNKLYITIAKNESYILTAKSKFNLIRKFRKNKNILSVIITTDGKYALSGGLLDTLLLWNMNTGELIRTFEGHTRPVYSVATISNGKYFISGSHDDTFKVWDINTGKSIKTFQSSKTTYAFTIDPNEKYILSAEGSAKTLKMWDINTGKLIKIFEKYTAGIGSVAITPDGKYALSGSSDKTLILWNINTGKLIKTFEGHTDTIFSVAITPDGKYALSGSSDKTLILWNIETGKLIKTFEGHTDTIFSVAITPDGKYALSGGLDNGLRLWYLGVN